MIEYQEVWDGFYGLLLVGEFFRLFESEFEDMFEVYEVLKWVWERQGQQEEVEEFNR